jgi:non-heme chloroperoxidase
VTTRTVILTTLVTLPYGGASQVAWAQHEIQSGYFQTSDGVQLHYLEAGSGPTIVFVPGWIAPAEIWEPQLAHFAATHRVVALDPRSQGRSEKTTEGHHLSRRAQDIGELIEHLDAAPAVVAGWSLGVAEVLTYTQQFGTDKLLAVVLVDYFLGVDQEPGDPHPLLSMHASTITRLQLDRHGFTREFVHGLYRSQQSDEYLDAMTQAAMATPTNTAVTLIANVALMSPSDLRPALQELDRPLAYMQIPRPFDLDEMVRELRPDAYVEVFENAGHALFVDEPERFNRLLEEFLASLPER